jgi:hypothetical protein
MMRGSNDLWFLRFPDGRVLRAAGTGALRQQLAAGRIPAGTHLRRSLDEEWRALELYPELADLAVPPDQFGLGKAHATTEQAPATIASRLDPLRLRQIGIRGLLEELLAAVDSTAVRLKLTVAVSCGVIAGVLAGWSFLPLFTFEFRPPGPGWLLVLGVIVTGIWLTAVQSRLTFSELSRLRPARWTDAQRGLGGLVVRLFLLEGGLALLFAALIVASRWLPGLLLESAGEAAEISWLVGAQVAAVAGILVEALSWTAILLLLPLGPLLAVEECSVLAGLARWHALLRQDLGRLLLAESLAVGIAVLLALPMGLILLAVWIVHPIEPAALAVNVLRTVLAAMAGGVVLSYLVVANVFIYLHLRYEPNGRR